MLRTVNPRKINTSNGTQSRITIDMSVVRDYTDHLRQGGTFPPIELVFDGENFYIVDGWHRLYAYLNLMYSEIQCEVSDGTYRDAILKSLGVNSEHGLRRTNADKRNAVETMLRDEEWGAWSNVKIAQACNVSEFLVRNAREEFHTSIKSKYEEEMTSTNSKSDSQNPDNSILSTVDSIKNDTGQSPPETRTFTHPKTGKETQMNVSNIGKRNTALMKEAIDDIENTPENNKEIQDLINDIENTLIFYKSSTNPTVKNIITQIKLAIKNI